MPTLPDLPRLAPCPECRQGKCRNCTGASWDNDADVLVPCPCQQAGHGGPKLGIDNHP